MSDIADRRASARSAGDPDYRQRRADLIAAAAKVFKEKGFRAASVNDIAREVGIDRASLYYYASGKEELFHEVIREATLDNVLMAERVRAADGTAPEKIRAFIIALMASYERHYPYLYVYVQEDMARITDNRTAWGREMNSLSKRFDEAVIGIVDGGLADGSLWSDLGDSKVIAFGIIGMCNWTHRWFRPGRGDNAEAVAMTFAEMVLRGLKDGVPDAAPTKAG